LHVYQWLTCTAHMAHLKSPAHKWGWQGMQHQQDKGIGQVLKQQLLWAITSSLFHMNITI